MVQQRRKVYFDSRDLIRLISRDEPMCPHDFGALLNASGWELVYSFPNICESMLTEEILESRRRLQVLDQIPHTFILALPPTTCLEFRAADIAFANNTEPEGIANFMDHWHQTYRYPGQPNYQDFLVNYHLVDQVLPLVMNNPDLFRNLQRRAFSLQLAVDEDRNAPNAVRRNRARFEGGVRRLLRKCRIQERHYIREFARWIRNDPRRCPGWRIFHETYLEFCSNIGDRVDEGDIRDFSHVACLPYVDAITLDRRMAGYCRAAAVKLHEENVAIDYADRVFQDSESWLAAI
jgi:hypothetical protein